MSGRSEGRDDDERLARGSEARALFRARALAWRRGSSAVSTEPGQVRYRNARAHDDGLAGKDGVVADDVAMLRSDCHCTEAAQRRVR